MKSIFKALRSGSSTKGARDNALPAAAGGEDENVSPLAPPKRLLSFTPASAKQDSRLRLTKSGALQEAASPRALQYDDRSTPRNRLVREGSLRASSTSKIAAAHVQARAGSTPLATPRLSRFSHNHNHDAAPAAAAAGEGAELPDPGSDNIRVIVRVRPQNEREASLGGAVCVQPLSRNTLRVAAHPEPHSFAFDHVADERATQESMFRVVGKPIVENCLAGYNGCIFAYGQTGSGKTHTMLGADAMACDPRDDSRGLIQRVFEHLFARIQERQADEGGQAKYNLRCCFLEIYNECITDLLNPSATHLAVREDLRRGVYIEGLHEAEVTSVEDVVGLLQLGAANRRVAETEMNEKSSRSHSVFTCTLESKTTDEFGAPHLRFSRLHLVDLAGSERQKSSGAAGERLKEASSINKSLSTLGLVIMSLVDRQHGKARHIPYRDSRLTFLLQDSLGGNAKTCLVATISPAAINMAETLSTLRFADNAKRIRNKAIINEDLGDAAALRREVKRLREELAAARRTAGQQAQGSLPASANPNSTPARIQAAADAMAGTPLVAGHGGTSSQPARKALVGALRREDAAVKQVRRLEGQIEGLKEMVQALQQDVQRNQMMMKLKESRLARLQQGGTGGVGGDSGQVEALQQELALLKAKLEAHPEVKRFAVENMHLGQELERLTALVNRDELAALHGDLDVLRGEMLALADGAERAQEEAAAHKALAEAAKLEAELAAEQIRAKAVAEVQARAAAEAAQLRAQVFEQQRQAKEQEAALGTAKRENEELAARVAMLTEEMAALEAARSAMRAEMSPVKRQAQGYEHELDMLRQRSQVADLRASSEQTLRTQAELSLSQLQMRLTALEAECEQLRSTNQELFRAKSDAEQQRDSVVGVEALCDTLKQQLAAERATLADREANHAEALQQLEAARRQVAALQQEQGRLQGEVVEAEASLGRLQDEHQAEVSAAAHRIAAALKSAGEMQSELDARSLRVQELQAQQERMQAEADELTQRCTELHDENVRLTSKLAQRDNELLEIEQTVDKLEGRVDAAQKQGAAAAEESKHLQDKLTQQEQALEVARSELQQVQRQLADATSALADASDQVAELQDRLGAAEAQQAEMEYQLSDKSASLQETAETLARVKAELAALRQAEAELQARLQDREAALADAQQQLECSSTSEEQARARCTELAASLAVAEGSAAEQQQLAAAQRQQLTETQAALEAAQSQCTELGAALAEASRQSMGQQEQVAATASQLEAANKRVAELTAQLDRLKREVVLENQKALLLAGAEVQELKGQLAAKQEAVAGLTAQLQAKDREIAEVKGEMAAEVQEAAQQVQRLIAAEAQVGALQQELAALRQRLEGKEAEAQAAAREAAAAGQAATLTAAEAKAQIEELVRERELWIEELRKERSAASAAMDGLRALERRVEEGETERAGQAEALQETQQRAATLEEEVTQLTGQQNINQRIQYHKKVKDENNALREELGRLRIDAHRSQVRLERTTEELGKLRQAAGQGGLPDFDAEERLKEELARLAADNSRLHRQYAALTQAVASLAGGQEGASEMLASSAAESAGASSARAATNVSASTEDIVLEFGSPERSGGSSKDAAALEVAARRAIEDIRHAQQKAARGIADREQQIRLLQESQKLHRLRRASVVETAAH